MAESFPAARLSLYIMTARGWLDGQSKLLCLRDSARERGIAAPADEDLRERVRLVRDFDRLCHACIRSFIRFANTHAVEEREILVPKTVKVAVKVKR